MLRCESAKPNSQLKIQNGALTNVNNKCYKATNVYCSSLTNKKKLTLLLNFSVLVGEEITKNQALREKISSNKKFEPNEDFEVLLPMF
jgi:hypothetical protein